MAIGAGKYHDLCELVYGLAKARAVMVIIIDGQRGTGVSSKADIATTAALPEILEDLARQIRADRRALAGLDN